MSCGGAYALKVHMRVHTAEGKPHLCARCGKSFATVRHLNQHQEVHMGRTPSCQYCNKKTFTTTRALKDHEKRCSDRPDGPPAKSINVTSVMQPTFRRKTLITTRRPRSTELCSDLNVFPSNCVSTAIDVYCTVIDSNATVIV